MMRRALLPSVVLLVAARLLACVGEDPVLSSPNDDAGSSGNTPPPVNGPNEAGPSAEGGGDAGATTCNLAAPFGPPAELPVLNSLARETTPRLSRDELQIYFASSRGEADPLNYHVYTSSRARVDVAFDAPRRMTEIEPPSAVITSRQRTPMLSADGTWLLFAANFGPSGYDVAAARRLDDGGFGPGVAVAETRGPGDGTFDGDPWLTRSGALWFVSRRPTGVGETDIYRAAFLADGGATNVNLVPELSSTGLDGLPVLSEDELTIYFDSTRTGGKGARDIWSAHRERLEDDFSVPENVAVLNTEADDSPAFLSADGCRLYLSRHTIDAGASAEKYEILLATRPR